MTKELLFFCTLAAGDVTSTQAVLHRGGVELNPLMRGSLGHQVAFKSALCLGQSLITSKSKKKKALYLIGGAIGVGLIVNNTYQLNKTSVKINP